MSQDTVVGYRHRHKWEWKEQKAWNKERRVSESNGKDCSIVILLWLSDAHHIYRITYI